MQWSKEDEAVLLQQISKWSKSDTMSMADVGRAVAERLDRSFTSVMAKFNRHLKNEELKALRAGR